MILSEMETALKRYGFDSTDPLDTWLNWGLSELCKYHDWRFLEQFDNNTLTAGSAGLTWFVAANTIKEVLSIKLTGQSKPLRFVGPAQWHREMTDPTTTGTPEIFRITSTGLDRIFMTVYPVPTIDWATEMVYKAKEPKLVNPGDTPAYVPEDLHAAIVVRAAVFGLQAENEEDRAKSNMDAFKEIVNNAISDDDPYRGPLFVEDVMNYGS